MELYKYCKREHMDLLLNKGSLRLGTLFDWRKRNQYGEMVFDESDGYTKITGNIVFYDHSFVSDNLVVSTVSVEGSGTNELRHFKNELLQTNDFYTFSATMNYSESDHNNWYENEGYDACYVISFPKLFFRAISAQLPDATFRLSAPALYIDETASNTVFRDTFHSALLKNIKFFSQREFRALWKPNDVQKSISPRIIGNSSAYKYCSKYRVL